jgi:hypothetical protein
LSFIQLEGEDIPTLPNLVLNHFKAIAELKANKQNTFKSSVVSLFLIEQMIAYAAKEQKEKNEKENPTVATRPRLSFYSAGSILTKLKALQTQALTKKERKELKESDSFKAQMAQLEKKAMELAPLCEDRIKIVNSS